MADPKKEGWTWVHNSPKWHYYRGNRALCGRMLILKHPEEGYEERQPLRDACPSCAKKLEKEQKK